ncbi:MAG: hypothetical protein Kow0099_15460 [Candidatus Abyssubacteria bacterium]
MKRPSCSGWKGRIGKSMVIISLALALLCLTWGVVLANPSPELRSFKIFGNTNTAGLGESAEQGANPEKALPFSAMRDLLEPGADAYKKGHIRLSEKHDGVPGQPEAPRRDLDPGLSGRRSVTHSLLKPGERPAPALLLIKEITDQGVLYLGVLGLSIPW